MSAELFTPRGLWRALTPGDRALCLLLLVMSLAGAGWARATDTGASVAVVVVDREEVLRLPLARATTRRVEGRQGPVTVEVADGAVRVVDAPCPHHLCVAMGRKRAAGDLIACVPGSLVIRLEGGRADPDAPDAVSR
jgi:hypothetical protein